MFIGMGVSAVVPVIDGLRMFGLQQMQKQIGLSWLVLQGFLYILGAMLYAVSHHYLFPFRQLILLGTSARGVVSWKS